MSAIDEFFLEKISISGPTLASMIKRVSFSPGDVDGLIFGHVTRIVPSALSDDSPMESFPPASSSSDSPSELVARITSFTCSGTTLSFHNALGRVDSRRIELLRANSPDHLLGWFSARRRSPNRPSMREFSVASSISSQFAIPIADHSQNPKSNLPSCVFLLFTTPHNDQLIDTHEYRAYQLRALSRRFEPKSIDIINIGPAFRGHYGSFSPSSPFPFLNCELRSSEMSEDKDKGSLSAIKQMKKDQIEMNRFTEGFQVGNLTRLIGPEAANYTAGLEDLYEKMLAKTESLAKLVEKSSTMISEQENYNRKLRYRISRVD